jgi:hypothetical protein
MIKIRYRNELSPGLHAAAERHGRSTTVYLLPGLSTVQRRAALRRLKISAGRGYDPKLPAPQLALALLADRIRTTVGLAAAVFRSHPAGSTVPVMVVSAGAIAFLVLSAVSIRVIHGPAGSAASVSAGSGQPGGPIAAGLGDPPGPGGSITERPGQPGSGLRPGGQAGGNGPGTGTGNSNSDGNGNGDGDGASGGTSQGANPGASSAGGTTLTGSTAPTPTPGGDPTSAAPAASASSAPAPAASATTSKPSPTPTASNSGLCVNLGSLGLCL